MKEDLIEALKDLTVFEAKKTVLWKQVYDLWFNKDIFELSKDKKEFQKGTLLTAASLGAAVIVSEVWSGLTGTVQESEFISSDLSGDLGQLVTGKQDYRVTSAFGLRKSPTKGASSNHKGTDIALPINTPLYSPFNGTVISADRRGAGGITLVIQSSGGTQRVLMMHLNSLTVSSGMNVVKGQLVARSGNTGVSTGPHLHLAYQVKKGAQWTYIDPQKVLPRNNKMNSEVQYREHSGSKLKNLGAKINNPLSVTDSGIDWQGKVGTYTSGKGVRLVKFASLEQGVRAGMLNIYNKADRVRTINDFVNIYVTGGIGVDYTYANNLAKALGVSPTSPINLRDERTLKAVTSEVARLESGSILSSSVINRAYSDVNSYISNRSSYSTARGTSMYNKK